MQDNDLKRPLNVNNDYDSEINNQISMQETQNNIPAQNVKIQKSLENSSDDQFVKDSKLKSKKDKPMCVFKKYKFDGLKSINFWGYSVGHFYNDLCAAVWFNYLLYYLTNIRGFNKGEYAMLSGQIFDGIATPAVGILSDRTNTRIGKRTPWYLFGTVLVTFTFLPIYLYQITSSWEQNGTMELIFFMTLPGLFNIGWASVQISNMSLVPSLSCSTQRRDNLNSRRNTMTFVANIMVFVLCLGFTLIFGDSNQDSQKVFEFLAIFIVIFGLGLCAFFLVTVKEVPLCKIANQQAKEIKKILEDKIQNQLHQFIQQQQESKLKSETGIENTSSDQQQQNNENNLLHQKDEQQLIDHDNENEEQEKMMEKFAQDRLKHTKNPKKSENTMSLGQHMLAKEDDIEVECDEQGQIQESISSLRMTLKARQLTARQSSTEKKGNWKQWFREPLFYICGGIYMLVRLYCNVTQTCLQYYLSIVLKYGLSSSGEADVLTVSQTLVPLTMFIFSSLASGVVEKLFQKIGRKKTYLIGFIFSIFGAAGLILLDENTKNLVYIVVFVIGIAQALCLNTGITLISDVVGVRGSEGAFVFGFYSFLDKFLTGFVIFFLVDDQFKTNVPEIRYVISLLPFGSVVIAGILIYAIKTKNDGFQHGGDQNQAQNNSTAKEIQQLNKELAI